MLSQTKQTPPNYIKIMCGYLKFGSEPSKNVTSVQTVFRQKLCAIHRSN